MQCPKCETENPADARFCMRCGASLRAACPECGTELPAEAQFCFRCGHQLTGAKPGPASSRLQQYIPPELLRKLESARAGGGMQGERRIVTMLFCDVKGSTAAAEQLDPEDWAAIMNGAFEHLISPVYKYEGTLARLMGDAILAFFGAPIAHEDDPQRAVLAGLEILQRMGPYREQVQARWRLDFNVRVGINTGLVVVGEVGSDLRVEYTALGDAINLAARMEQTAEPGTVQIAEDTHRLVAPLFDCEGPLSIQVKGKSEPVRAFRVLRARPEPGSLRGIEGLSSPLIGREREMGRLRDAVRELLQGRGQLISVMGEAGLGKSRIVTELRRALASEGLLWATPSGAWKLRWHEGRSLSYQMSSPYASFVSLLSSCLGLREEQTSAQRLQSITSQVAEVMPGAALDTTPFIATLLGLQPEGEELERIKYLQPPQVREKTFAAVPAFVEGLAAAKPLVLVFEDLHWADATSLELLERLMSLTDRVPLMLIGVFRPLRQEPSWRFHEAAARDYPHRYTSIQLEPLDEGQSRALVSNLLHVEDLPDHVRGLILTKAEGNPFFVEEVIRSLLDANLVIRQNGHWRATREIENIAVPNTLVGVINARLDRLDEPSKRAVQAASVIGREFAWDALTAIYERRPDLEGAMADLLRREIVREKSRVPQRVYTFKHALTQEAAYASVLLSSRRLLHRKVAENLERAAPDHPADIARHFLEAGEEARALPHLLDAGDRAARSYSTREAIADYRKALEILQTVKDLALARRAYEGLGGALTFAFDVPAAVDVYDQMYHLAGENGDLPMQVSALNKLGYVTALMKGQFPEAEGHLEEAERLATQCGDYPGLAELHMTYCYIKTASGDFDGALDHQNRSLELGREMNITEARLFGMAHIANTLTFLTRFDEAWERARAALAQAEEAGNRRYMTEALTLPIPWCHLRNGGLDEAQRAAKRGTELAAQIGATDNEGIGEHMLAFLARQRGEYEDGLSHAQRAIRAGEASGMAFVAAAGLCSIAAMNMEIGHTAASLTTEYSARALTVVEYPLGLVMGGFVWTEVGFCCLALGQVDKAEELFLRALDTQTATRYLARPLALTGMAMVALARRDLDAAKRRVAEAEADAQKRGMRNYFPVIALQAGRIAAGSDGGEALRRFEQAQTAALAMQMRPIVWQASAERALLLARAGHPAEAQVAKRVAQVAAQEIAAGFKDESLRLKYLQTAAQKIG